MNRYFLYLILCNMIINVIMFVPHSLLQYRFDGAVMGIILSIPIGITLTVIYSRSLSKFPGQGLPEIMADSNRWLKAALFGSIQLAWLSAGMISLFGFIDILNRFVNPDMPKISMLLIYLAAIFLIIRLPTDRVMYLLEIVLFLNTPFIAFIVLKAITSPYLNWDSIMEVGTYIFEAPNLKVIAAATFVFTGHANLIIFNRIFKEKIKLGNFIIIVGLAVFNLFTSFFIPIGLNGADGAAEYLYPWVSASDSLRLIYSPIERVIYLFLMFYMSISLLSVSIHWHVALELLKGINKNRHNKKLNWIVLSAIAFITVVASLKFNTLLLHKIAAYWLIIRLFFEAVLVVVTAFWLRRRTA